MVGVDSIFWILRILQELRTKLVVTIISKVNQIQIRLKKEPVGLKSFFCLIETKWAKIFGLNLSPLLWVCCLWWKQCYHCYRVSHIEMSETRCIWRVEGLEGSTFLELWCLLSGFKRFGHLSGIKMTNTYPFLWNVLSKIQFFTDISTFSVDVTFLKTGHWNSTVQTSWSHLAPKFKTKYSSVP